jgi:hypothetical protein
LKEIIAITNNVAPIAILLTITNGPHAEGTKPENRAPVAIKRHPTSNDPAGLGSAHFDSILSTTLFLLI